MTLFQLFKNVADHFFVKISQNVLKENFFLTAIWLPHGQLWAIIEKAASLT